MKIISFSDVITNSSSEVFIIHDREALNRMKELVNSILSISSEFTFDNLFDIKMILDDWVEDEYKSHFPNNPNPSQKELEEFALDDKSYYELERVIGFDVIAKDPKYNKVASLIQNIDNIFRIEERYV